MIQATESLHGGCCWAHLGAAQILQGRKASLCKCVAVTSPLMGLAETRIVATSVSWHA